MDSADFNCWKCGGSLAAIELPLRRAELCPHCTADLHVCHMCRHFDRHSRRGCREPVADEVRDRERANFCGWFQIGGAAMSASSTEAAVAKNELESLFGLDPGSATGRRPTPTPRGPHLMRYSTTNLKTFNSRAR